MEKKKRRQRITAGIIFFFVVIVAIKMITGMQYKERTAAAGEEGTAAVYYLLNIDGMKGLGHSALMLVDGQGNGVFYSYNGMQYSLVECLMGKAGIGKMKVFELDSESVSSFLEDGNLEVSDVSECDNFDRALYTYISDQEYETLKEELEYYVEVGNKYQQLYADAYEPQDEEQRAAEAALEEYLSIEDIPRYQIYNHNCDTVAREMIAVINDEMSEYNRTQEKQIPLANYKKMCRQFGDHWGIVHIGEDTVIEKVLWYIL